MKTLDYFTKSDGSDLVSVGFTIDGAVGTLPTSDTVLTDVATKSGKSTWDEDTICSVLNLMRKPKPIVRDPAPEPDAPEAS